MYQKHEKPNIWYNPDHNEFYTHLGDEHFFASTITREGNMWNLGYGILSICFKCWSIEDHVSLFNNASLITADPLLRWSEE